MLNSLDVKFRLLGRIGVYGLIKQKKINNDEKSILINLLNRKIHNADFDDTNEYEEYCELLKTLL
ncbi:MAG: hypothetical protein KA319_06150 [Ferruginibacter sp.]|nr:hypothetical protein [Ferruginibacter sp.]